MRTLENVFAHMTAVWSGEMELSLEALAGTLARLKEYLTELEQANNETDAYVERVDIKVDRALALHGEGEGI